MTDWADLYTEVVSEPPSSEEQALQFALVDFRTMKPETQKAFMIAVLDEYVGQAEQGSFDRYFADQIVRRVNLMAGFLNNQRPGQLRVISNG